MCGRWSDPACPSSLPRGLRRGPNRTDIAILLLAIIHPLNRAHFANLNLRFARKPFYEPGAAKLSPFPDEININWDGKRRSPFSKIKVIKENPSFMSIPMAHAVKRLLSMGKLTVISLKRGTLHEHTKCNAYLSIYHWIMLIRQLSVHSYSQRN